MPGDNMRMTRVPDPHAISRVNAWFAANARELPWRKSDCGAWGVLVSEIMLQQTPVVRVLRVWHEWMQRWPMPADLAAAQQADAVRAWGRLGYPRRAKRLWECAVAIVERHGGQVPRDREDLLALPGVGDYTASAVMSFAWGDRALVLDTNVRRVIARAWRGEPLPPPSITASERAMASTLVPARPAEAALWAAASMELGALVCTARAPRCQECPLRDECAWFSAGRPWLESAERRAQPWHGTDRQVRGQIMAILRTATSPAVIESRVELALVPPSQVETCIDSLVADGLIRASARSDVAFELA